MSKIEELTEALSQRIRSGEWEEALPPRQALSKEYGVSPATISVAVRSLQREGLVTIVARKGAFVATGMDSAQGRSTLPRIGLIGSYIPSTQDLSESGMGGLFKQLIFEGIWTAANESKNPLTLIPQIDDPQQLSPAYCRDELGVDSLIFLGGEHYDSAIRLRQSGFPVILANKPTHPTPLNYLDYDNTHLIQNITQRFINAGHRRIAAIHCSSTVPGYYRILKKEFVSCLAEAHLFYPFELYWRECHRENPSSTSGGDSAILSSAATVEALLNLPEPPTAIFSWSYISLPGILETLKKRGLNIPADISIATTAFDSPESAPTSGYIAPHREMGRRLVAELLETIRNPYHAVQELLPLSFVDKSTIAPPPQ